MVSSLAVGVADHPDLHCGADRAPVGFSRRLWGGGLTVVDREIVKGEVEHSRQGDDGEESGGRNPSRLDLAEGLDGDTSGDGNLTQAR
jgi:hypothetical protein